jgi:hypothetical protein
VQWAGGVELKTWLYKILLWFVSVLGAFLCWRASLYDSAWWALFGIPGGVASYLIEGPHRGGHIQSIMSMLANILVNSVQNYIVLRYSIRKFMNRNKPEPLSIL